MNPVRLSRINLSCAVVLLFAPLVGQAELANLLGPLVFEREIGKPATTVSEFSVEGFGAPYILHVQNGDENGEHRASSAEVWLNGQLLFDRSQFSMKVHGYEVEVDLTPQSRLEVWMASKPGSQLAIWIEGTPPVSNAKKIGPEGGVFEFPGDITFEVPQGAVTESVDVELSLTNCDALGDIINSRPLSTKPVKRCLASFEGKPSGLKFNLPVLVRLPIGKLASGNVPILMDVDRLSGAYQLLPTVIDYDGESGVMQVQLNGFSEKANGAYELSPDTEFGPGWAAAGEEIKTRCSSCGAQNDNGGANLPFCENLDQFQTSCCLIPPIPRQLCAPNCYCCKEEEARVIVSDVDFSSGNCQLLGSSIKVTYPRCPGSPTFEDSMEEASEECGENMAWQITVDPPSPSIRACDQLKFTATIEGSSPDGSIVIKPAKLPAFWTSTDTSVADFVDGNGLLGAKGRGTLDVEARVSANNPIDAVGRASVFVDSNIDSFTVSPSSKWLEIDEQVHLVAEVVAAPGVSPAPDPMGTAWTSSDSGVASITPAGSIASVRGDGRGSAEITAELDYRCETVKATSDITVECKDVEFTVSDTAIHLGIGESYSVVASATDLSDGSSLDASGVTWHSWAETVVGLGNDVGSQTSVQALQPTALGPVPVTATYNDGCQTEQAETMVTVSCPKLELSVEEGVVAIDAFLPIAVSATNGIGEPFTLDESKIEWSSSDPDVASVIPTVGFLTNVIGISQGVATITATYDAGPCTDRTATATIKVGFGISGVWHLSPVTQSEQCRYSPHDWWPEDGFTGFDVNIEQPVGEDDSVITASYVPDVGLRLSGNWDRYTGVFDLAVDTTDPSQCGYLYFWDDGADLCGDAVDCQFESCQIVTNIDGTTSSSTGGPIDGLDASSDWYYSVMLSFDGGAGVPRGTTTWECLGNATLSGSR